MPARRIEVPHYRFLTDKPYQQRTVRQLTAMLARRELADIVLLHDPDQLCCSLLGALEEVAASRGKSPEEARQLFKLAFQAKQEAARSIASSWKKRSG